MLFSIHQVGGEYGVFLRYGGLVVLKATFEEAQAARRRCEELYPRYCLDYMRKVLR